MTPEMTRILALQEKIEDPDALLVIVPYAQTPDEAFDYVACLAEKHGDSEFRGHGYRQIFAPSKLIQSDELIVAMLEAPQVDKKVMCLAIDGAYVVFGIVK